MKSLFERRYERNVWPGCLSLWLLFFALMLRYCMDPRIVVSLALLCLLSIGDQAVSSRVRVYGPSSPIEAGVQDITCACRYVKPDILPFVLWIRCRKRPHSTFKQRPKKNKNAELFRWVLLVCDCWKGSVRLSRRFGDNLPCLWWTAAGSFE